MSQAEAAPADFTRLLGMATVRTDDGTCVMELPLDERHMSVARRAHGGVLFSLLDTALGRAVISALPEGKGCATVECKINYFRPVLRGRLVAEAKVVTKTRRLAYGEAEIRDEEDRIVARGPVCVIQLRHGRMRIERRQPVPRSRRNRPRPARRRGRAGAGDSRWRAAA